MKSGIKTYIFEILIAILYIALAFLYPNKVGAAFLEGMHLILNLLPIFLCVMFFSSFLGVFLSPKTVQKFMGKKSGLKGIVLAVLFGTVIVGPLWVLFPLYKTLLNKGARMAVVGAMVGAFAIKTPWLPFGASLLGWPFISLTTILIFLYAIIQGYIMESVLSKKAKNKI